MRIHGNGCYVGTCGIAVILIATPKGHILIDAATDEAVPSILAVSARWALTRAM